MLEKPNPNTIPKLDLTFTLNLSLILYLDLISLTFILRRYELFLNYQICVKKQIIFKLSISGKKFTVQVILKLSTPVFRISKPFPDWSKFSCQNFY